MNIRRRWVVVGATVAAAGFAGAGIAMANDDVELKDERPAPVVELRDDSVVGNSAASARSADSAADSPGEPGYGVPAPPKKVADSGNSPAAKVRPAGAASANSPAPPAPVVGSADSPAPVRARPAPVVGSVDSPAPARVRPAPVAGSADSPAPARVHRPAPADSAASGGSADSGD